MKTNIKTNRNYIPIPEDLRIGGAFVFLHKTNRDKEELWIHNAIHGSQLFSESEREWALKIWWHYQQNNQGHISAYNFIVNYLLRPMGAIAMIKGSRNTFWIRVNKDHIYFQYVGTYNGYPGTARMRCCDFYQIARKILLELSNQNFIKATILELADPTSIEEFFLEAKILAKIKSIKQLQRLNSKITPEVINLLNEITLRTEVLSRKLGILEELQEELTESIQAKLEG